MLEPDEFMQVLTPATRKLSASPAEPVDTAAK
jgi:hypothetical protein